MFILHLTYKSNQTNSMSDDILTKTPFLVMSNKLANKFMLTQGLSKKSEL